MVVALKEGVMIVVVLVLVLQNVANPWYKVVLQGMQI